jgi:hypothetical protein
MYHRSVCGELHNSSVEGVRGLYKYFHYLEGYKYDINNNVLESWDHGSSPFFARIFSTDELSRELSKPVSQINDGNHSFIKNHYRSILTADRFVVNVHGANTSTKMSGQKDRIVSNQDNVLNNFGINGEQI